MLCWRPAKAQQVKAPFRSLSIGDTVPDVIIQNVLNYKTPTAKVSDFRGKLLILDFWAYWCSPCVYMIPRMDSLQKQFDGKIQFLAVTTEPAAKVSGFRAKHEKRFGKRIAHPEVVSDTVLSRMFYHSTFPHYVWIDQTGVVRAITDMKQVKAETISSLLQKSNQVISEKKDAVRIPYSDKLPLVANGNGGDGSKMFYHSVMTSYTPGIPGGFSLNTQPNQGKRITVRNCSRLWLYRIAYAQPGKWFDQGSVVIESDSASALTSKLYGADYRNWLDNGHGFCYELIVPASLSEKTNQLMRRDLENLFPEFSASVELRRKKCLVLQLTGDKSKLESSSKGPVHVQVDRFGWQLNNATLSMLVDRINKSQNHPIPVVDQTGLKERVNLQIESGLSDLTALNAELARYGLRMTETELEQDVLVIRDNLSASAR